MPLQISEQPSIWHLIKQFIHLRRFAFTVFLPLMGAATAGEQATLAEILFIVVTTFQFHVFTYALNDVIDLPLDKLMAKRKNHPLVRGDISRKTALSIGLIQLPFLLILVWLAQISLYALGAFTIAFILMAIYDIWGKKLAFPPTADFIQAISYGSLTLYGTWIVGNPSFLTWILVFIFIMFILLINGVFESVIDIKEDSTVGLKTTAMIFGAKSRGGVELPFIPPSLFIYCIVLEVILSVLNMIPLVRNDFGYNSNLRTILLMIVIVLNIVIVGLSIQFIIPAERFRKRVRDEHIDLISAFSILILLVSYVPYLEPQFVTAILICTVLPVILGSI